MQILCWCWSRVLVQFLKTSNLAKRGHWHWGQQPQQPASHNLAPQLSAIYFKNKFVLKLLQIIRLVKYPVELTGNWTSPQVWYLQSKSTFFQGSLIVICRFSFYSFCSLYANACSYCLILCTVSQMLLTLCCEYFKINMLNYAVA